MSNKTKVLLAARRLFNRDGLLNVRLQHISDEAVVSVGNISYHFPGKEHIVLALWEELLTKKQEFLLEFRIVPLFEDMERLLRQAFEVQQEYQFFYIDAPNILNSFPAIAQSWLAHQQRQCTAIEMMLEFNVARGVLHPKHDDTYFSDGADLFWALSDGWLSRQRSLGRPENDYAHYRRILWRFLQTLMTEQGIQEFQQLEAMIAQRIV